MIVSKKVLIITLSCAASVVLLLIAFAFIAPLLIDQNFIRGKIVREISRSLNAEVQVGDVALSLLPRPCVVAHGVSLALSSGASARIKKASVHPALLPLLSGDVQPAQVSLDAPEMNVPLPEKKIPAATLAADFSVAGMQQQAVVAIASLAEKVPPCSVTVKGGAVRFSSPDGANFIFSGISADLAVSAGQVTVSAGCASNLWKELTLQASAGISDRHINGTVSFSGLSAGAIADYFFPGSVKIGSSAISGTLTAAADKTGALRAELTCAVPHLTLNETEKKQVIKGTLNQLLLTADARTAAVSFSAQFDYPQLSATGKCTLNTGSREIALAVDGKNIAVASCREVLAACAANQPWVSAVNARLQGGTITDITFEARGPLGSNLIENKHCVLKAGFTGGSILLPEAGLALQGVNGELAMQDAMLELKNLEASCGKSRAYSATLRLDPSRQYRPMLIDAMFSCDLSQLPALVRLIPASDLKNELSLITSPQGIAGGRFRLREENGSYLTAVDITGLNLNAGYRKFPAPIELRNGSCIYRDGDLAFKELSGKLGSSEISAVSASFSLRDDHLFKITSSGATISLDELLVALNSFPATQKIIRDVTQATGSIAISSLDINGPLANPEAWKFALRGGVQDVTLAASLLEGPVKIKSGALQVNQRVFSLSEARAAFGDNSLEGSLTLNGYLQGIQKASASVRGSLGARSLERIRQYSNFPAELLPRTPLSVAKSRINWTRTGETAFSGDFSCGTGPKVSLDLRSDPQALEIKKLKISGQNTESLLRLGIKEDRVDAAFTGAIDKETLDRLLADNRFVRGWIKGDITVQMDQKNPLQSTATGTLAWKDVQFPGIERLPVEIKSASVAAAGNSLQVAALDASVGNCDVHAKGSVTFTEQGYVLDMDAASDSINLDNVENAMTKGTAHPGAGAEELWETPLRGMIRVAARSLTRGALTWEPFNANVLFADSTITIAATEAKLCDIATPGTIVVTPETMTLEVKPAAQNAAVKTVVKCLTGEKSIITGTFDLKSDLLGQGSAFNLADNLAGKISITARKGRIYRSNLLTKILSFLSIRNLLTGGTTDIAQKGFAYRSINIQGKIKGSTLTIDEGVLDSNTLSLAWQGSVNLATEKINITVLATPFQLSDLVLMSIPVVGIVFSRTLIGVPLQVTGTIDDPKLGPASPLAIGKGLLGVITNMVKLPVKIIEPVLPGKGAHGQ
jgi:hypothetical protein